MRRALTLAAVLVAALAGCKPPPTDSAVSRVSLVAPASGPSEPLPSPDVTGAVWAATPNPLRLVYGVPGKPVLLAIECLEPAAPTARLKITRQSPADPGASALLALIGNGYIGRFPVDAANVKGQSLWQGEAPAIVKEWDALKPENPSPLPMALVTMCRGNLSPEPPAAPGSAPEEAAAVR